MEFRRVSLKIMSTQRFGVKSNNTFTANQISTCSQIIDFVTTVLFFFLPEGKVLFQEFNDTLGVSEVFLLELVNLVKGLLEGLVCKFAGSFVVLHDLIVENGEVEGKTELDWVAWWENNLVGLIVSLESFLFNSFKLVLLGIFGDVAIVISNHLDEESL